MAAINAQSPPTVMATMKMNVMWRTGGRLTSDETRVDLSELRVEDVFERLWASKFDEPVAPNVRRALCELVEAAEHEDGAAP